jgi:ribonuclease BN (tRNA processing enzyme)
LVRLARSAHTLIHEATFPERDRGKHGVHSTAAEAGQQAQRAGVQRLILTHIDAEYHEGLEALAAEARAQAAALVDGRVAIEVAIFDRDGGLVGRAPFRTAGSRA